MSIFKQQMSLRETVRFRGNPEIRHSSDTLVLTGLPRRFTPRSDINRMTLFSRCHCERSVSEVRQSIPTNLSNEPKKTGLLRRVAPRNDRKLIYLSSKCH